MKTKKKNERMIQELFDTIRKSDIRIMGTPKEEEKGTESICKQIIDEKFPILRNELDLWIQEAIRTPNYPNLKRPSPRHTILKLSKFNDKERIIKAAKKRRQ